MLTDGSSDTVLIPIARWVLSAHTTKDIELRWADLRGLRDPPRGLANRIAAAVDLFPCDLLFVHRDAERDPPDHRHVEIASARPSTVRTVPVVPVRMQEAWLLHDEPALRRAAGRPSDRTPLGLPLPARAEEIPDPKQLLHNALLVASGFRGRRAQRFRPSAAAHRLADLIDDWSPLRRLPAFQRFEADTVTALTEIGLVE